MITIKVIEKETLEVVKTYKNNNQRQADATNFYLDHQLNHEKYTVLEENTL